MLKSSLLSQPSRVNNSIILKFKNAKFSGYCFYMELIAYSDISKSVLMYL